jgi:hypothetical protein
LRFARLAWCWLNRCDQSWSGNWPPMLLTHPKELGEQRDRFHSKGRTPGSIASNKGTPWNRACISAQTTNQRWSCSNGKSRCPSVS